MRRTLTLIATLAAAALSVGLAAAPAQAAPQVVAIADADSRMFATANTADQLVRMAPRLPSLLQEWSIEPSSTTDTRVINAGTRGCLGVSTLAPSPINAPVIQSACRNDPAELWRIVRATTDPTVRFVHTRTGLCMAVENASPSLRPQLRVQRCDNTAPNQRFRLV